MIPLPIDPRLPEVVDAIRNHRSLVLVAEPGAGKTTRVPPALLDSGLLGPEHPRVVVLQPRRVAARATATRIAEERGGELGEEVGYLVRFERRVGPRTRLVVATEGVLTRQLLDDPGLAGVGAVVLDEFHERSVHSDLAVALLREVREALRDDLILVVMSATLDAEPVSRFLGAPVLRVEGRTFPVAIEYRASDGAPLPDRAAEAVLDVLRGPEDPGDVLVFLPGAEEIRRTARLLEPVSGRGDVVVLPLHGLLPSGEQDRALRPSDRRKVVLATNIAETSLTIDGIRTVIDGGYARFASSDPSRGLDRLELGRISRASAEQRAGRAGRTAPGRCIRLWSERETRGLAPFDPPEVRRVDLASTVLTLHAWGVADPKRFPWFEAPEPDRIEAAGSLLEQLGAVEPGTGRVTPIGEAMRALPIHPRLSRLLIASQEAGIAELGATAAAMLSEKDLLGRGRDSRGRSPDVHSRSDLLVRIDLLREAERAGFSPSRIDPRIDPKAARTVSRVRDDLLRIADRRPARLGAGASDDPEEALLKALVLAFPDRVARRRGIGDPSGRMVGGRGVRLDPESVVREGELFLAIDAREDRRGAGRLELRVRIASAVDPSWLLELFPGAVRREEVVRFDEARGRVVGLAVESYRDLALREAATGSVDSARAAEALADALSPRAEDVFQADEAASRWLSRVGFLRRWLPEAGFPAFDPEELAEALHFACLGKRSEEEVRRSSLVPMLQGRLMPEQLRLLDEEAPEAIEVPSGSRHRVSYEGDGPPVLAVRLQELFGWTETPRLARGRVPVLLHLLGPNFRPVQVTDDLASFWTTTYHQVRKDLRNRYPRHSWPEDPWTAAPEAKGGRRRT
ncbi:ATP-dependent helicase HrpB [Tautonia sociabilis]|uniref:ATP-dependent helicase HrpB n=1 Tax=Tautonia sociabilis TaxID=2080755 RepID=A0A432MPC5_9BACT|nr:ATP-dependent helicase HrpB [Tautonia sociabilis]RUL89284.1 ATP-dependent helicase HrpB [Tautonia sociabilis]